MSVRKLLINGLFIAIVAACAGVAACTDSKKDSCESCSANGDCKSGNCASFTAKDGSGKKFLLCADSSTSNCSVPQ